MQNFSAPQSRAIPALDVAMQERIHNRWDELAAFGAARSEAAVQHLLASVSALVNAQNAFWMGAVRIAGDDRDCASEWRPRAARFLRPLARGQRASERLQSRCAPGGIEETTLLHVRLGAQYRAGRLRDLVPSKWFESDAWEYYAANGVGDLLVVGAPVSKTSAVYYGFLRVRRNDPFTEEQCYAALYAMRGLTWFHRKVLLAEGLVAARAPLSPMEKKVLALLLTDQCEKRIAANLDLAPTTVHTYVRDVFRKFGVSGRNGLTALWLGRAA